VEFPPLLPASGGFPRQPLSNTALAETPAVTMNLRREIWLKNSDMKHLPGEIIYFLNMKI
jgi:hypothetical protein